MAFSIESYVNSLGYRKLKNWTDIERKNWKDKIKLLHKETGYEADWSKGHLKFATDIFELRDKLAHGRLESIEGQITTDHAVAKNESDGEFLRPEWYKKITAEWLIDSKVNFTELMSYLALLCGFESSDYLVYAKGAIKETHYYSAK